MPTSRRNNFSFEPNKPCLVLGEGPHDRAFFRALMRARHIGGYQTVCPNDLGIEGGGNTRWKEALNALVGTTGFETLRGLVIVADNDDNPNDAFTNVQQALHGAAEFTGPPYRKFPVPNNPLDIQDGPPAVSVVMMPGTGVRGCLENLTADVAYNAASAAIRTCVDDYCSCAGFNGLSESKKSKARLRSLIACGHHANPEISSAKVWNDCPGVIPLNDHRFTSIADHLTSFHDHVVSPP